jgi:hypothetical protein
MPLPLLGLVIVTVEDGNVFERARDLRQVSVRVGLGELAQDTEAFAVGLLSLLDLLGSAIDESEVA